MPVPCSACRYKLNLVNLVKSDSLYTSGMQPLLHSQLLYKRRGLGWHRAGSSVAYHANSVKKAGGEHYYSISFVLDGLPEGDVLHLAHCYPFTYTDLQRHLHVLQVGSHQRYGWSSPGAAARLAARLAACAPAPAAAWSDSWKLACTALMGSMLPCARRCAGGPAERAPGTAGAPGYHAGGQLLRLAHHY